MPHRHLSVESLGRVARGEVEGKEVVRAMLDHLLALCPHCRHAWRQVVLPSGERGLRAGETPYATLLQRAVARAREIAPSLEQEQREAPERVAELLAVGERQQVYLLEQSPRFLTWGVTDLLIRESHRAAFEDPEAAAALARLAISLANRLNESRYGAAFVSDVKAMAWAYYGNAHRVGSDLRQAEQALQMSEELIEQGTGDPLIRAQWLSLVGTLRRDQRLFEEALCLFAEAGKVYSEAGDRALEDRAELQVAGTLIDAGRPEEAIPKLRDLLSRFSPNADDRLVVCAHHSLVTALVDADLVAEAMGYFQEISSIYERHGDFSTQTRRLWLEGRLMVQLGREEEAARALTATRRAFLERGIGYDAALVSLELAALHLGRGEVEAVKRLAEEMLPIFRSRDVHREAMAALLLFQQAARNEALSRELLTALTSYLRRARRDSRLRFPGLDSWRDPV